jgi:hypothetical protein
VVLVKEVRIAYSILSENQNGKDHLENLSVDKGKAKVVPVTGRGGP